MSHFANIELEITDVQCLKTALEALGLTNIETHLLAEPLQTYWSDKATANVIVRYAKNPAIGRSDIGFQLVNGKYQMLADDYELRKGMNWNEATFTTAVKVEYGIAAATKAAKAKGMNVVRETNNGRVQLRLTPQRVMARR